MTKHTPVPLTETADEGITLKACATELFRWVRAGVELVEQSPALIKEVSDDIAQAWHDSAKR